MKFLTDENIAVSVVEFLRKRGFNVKDIKEELMHGIPDKDIFGIAQKEKRIIITHDKDFAEIIKNYKKDFEGIILVRCKIQNPENISTALDKLFNMKVISKIKNSLIILNEEQFAIVND